jgi:uncharacterized protein
MQNAILTTEAYVKKAMEGAEAGHDWAHIARVRKHALDIAKREPDADLLVVELGALLHDIADAKFSEGSEAESIAKTQALLESFSLSVEVVEHIIQIIKNVSYSGGNKEKSFHSLELAIIQDADRLEALGAIGIARCFHYGGYKNRPMHTPDIPPKLNMTPEEYRKNKGSSINHFYEKLLRLKDTFQTARGRELAEARHTFMEEFIERFLAEWEGTV